MAEAYRKSHRRRRVRHGGSGDGGRSRWYVVFTRGGCGAAWYSRAHEVNLWDTLAASSGLRLLRGWCLRLVSTRGTRWWPCMHEIING
ncbi:hypothetical protein DY000_02021894 [Brassica cretica]|uniref:Uncharacterized protein n=1 Tax=Brassica cretica TaxID=69181 RepID=A0ABQ7EGY1_BRACR|nr:hypothetical protein DY000_02021894 [Brassica cretica]